MEERAQILADLAERLVNRLEPGFDSCNVPTHLRAGLLAYILDGRPTGHFLQAVLSNDLMEAMARADLSSRAGLHSICSFLYSYAPMNCRGSEKHYSDWIAHGGFRGLMAITEDAPST